MPSLETQPNLVEYTLPPPELAQSELMDKAYIAYSEVLGVLERQAVDNPNQAEFSKFVNGLERHDTKRAALLRAVRKLIYQNKAA